MPHQHSLRQLARDPLLFIYQMPKAGSQTVEATLARCGLPHKVFRFHFLSGARARKLKQGLRDPASSELWRTNVREQLAMRDLLCQVLRVRRWRSWLPPKRPKLLVITGVRDPIGVCLSATFESYFDSIASQGSSPLDYCRYVLTAPRTLPCVQDWFEMELEPFLGLNVYRETFPRDRGYAIYENRFARVLVYRFEALARLPAMLEEFLGCPVPEVMSRNIGSRKEYAEQYRSTREQLRLPPSLVAAACNSRLMRHFYSAEERRVFEQQWAGPVDSTSAMLAV